MGGALDKTKKPFSRTKKGAPINQAEDAIRSNILQEHTTTPKIYALIPNKYPYYPKYDCENWVFFKDHKHFPGYKDKTQDDLDLSGDGIKEVDRILNHKMGNELLGYVIWRHPDWNRSVRNLWHVHIMLLRKQRKTLDQWRRHPGFIE